MVTPLTALKMYLFWLQPGGVNCWDCWGRKLKTISWLDLADLPLIPVGMYMYFITYPPSAILNLPISSFYPPDTALVLTSDIFLSLFPPLLPSSNSFLWRFSHEPSLHVFTYIYALLVDRGISECWNILIRFLCALLSVFFNWKTS